MPTSSHEFWKGLVLLLVLYIGVENFDVDVKWRKARKKKKKAGF
jgi:hypothetical protein